MSFNPTAKFGAVRQIVGSATAANRKGLLPAPLFEFHTSKPENLTLTFGRSVSVNGDDAATVPIYARVTCGVGRASFVREVDVGPLNALQVVAESVSVETFVDERFHSTDFSADVFVAVAPSVANVPAATKSTLSLSSETIAPAGEWLSNIPSGAMNVSVLCRPSAQLVIGVGSAKNGVAIAGTSGSLGWKLPIPSGAGQLSVVNAGASPIERPTLVYEVR